MAYPIVASPQYRLAFRVLKMSPRDYFNTLWPALSSTLVMVLTVGAVLFVLPHTMPPVMRLILEVLTGVVTYTGMIAWRHCERALAFVSIVREHAL